MRDLTLTPPPCRPPPHTGSVRILPVLSQRMLLWSFKESPDANFKLQVLGGGGRRWGGGEDADFKLKVRADL